ncbi:transglycosylase domain-containing protein [Candidatus Marinarcus aquaticus]|uniref:Penicillin-binding protein n=1 Tax=Candidatus Marinarcus aquaticus TaxID=2044504 RepID=A0A4Q0XPL7_9BACT|nr:PBP1A family penicillin-binding protein [Candidatus Marinarcus aquaticus]RXJ56177.1 penicillin-binding protein [Candidatus Marinarcus aquaticus]
MKYIIGFFTVIGLALLAFLLYLYSEIRFEINQIVDYNPKLTTQFFDKDGQLVANIFQKEHRIYVKYEDIPPKVIEALIAIEDTQFFEHNGVNTDAILRAIIKDIKARKLVEGASTLTQQLIKNMLLTREKKFTRKLKEVLLALRLETILSKEEILERYLNQVYFGHGYYGIRTASLGYFKKELFELNLKEIAILVGLPRAPSFYSPTKNLKFALVRANQVVNRLKTLGWINDREHMEAISYVPAVYDETLTLNKAPYVIDYALNVLSNDIPDVKYGGYKINLTIDLKAQEIARKSLQYGYDNIKKREEYFKKTEALPEEEYVDHTATLNGGLITIENKTGKILTLLGGVNYKESNFNRVIQSKRQPGSAIKPFLYQTALNLGYSPATNLIDISRTYSYTKDDEEKKWQPKNYEENYKGLITLREALLHSRNLATINLVNDIGIDIAHKNLRAFGFEDVPMDLSITLGSLSISPFELSRAYTMFSNNGIQVQPYIVSSIVNKNNQTIVFQPQENYIQPPEQAYLITSILHDTVQRGTGKLAKVKGLDIAGKTGTTNSNVDAWFCGYTPTLQTVIWYGNDDNKPMRKSETGGRSAGTVFGHFYRQYLQIHPEIKRNFEIPEGVHKSVINGKTEYFTDTSKLPELKIEKDLGSTREF